MMRGKSDDVYCMVTVLCVMLMCYNFVDMVLNGALCIRCCWFGILEKLGTIFCCVHTTLV